MRPGLWARAGQTGVVCGLDWAALRALIPPASDVERVLALAAALEDGMLEGAAEAARDEAVRARARDELEGRPLPTDQ